MLTTWLIEFFHRQGKLQSDASIGVTFTWLFALGVILLSVFAGQVDLDQDCVLYGEIAYVPLDVWITAGGANLGPRAVWRMGAVFAIAVAFVLLGYKELLITTFDPQFAKASGYAPGPWHYALMGAVSITTVAAFESVGAILVVAFLIVPPVTAYILTNNLKLMLLITAAIGVLISIVGYYLAAAIDGSIAGAMSTIAGGVFLLALLFSPLQGVLTRRWRKSRQGAHQFTPPVH